MTARLPDRDKFWSKVLIAGPDECWPWMGAISERYGIVGTTRVEDSRDTTIRAHIVAFCFHNEYRPGAGIKVCHSCDNPPCCNPRHLWSGTHQDNMTDMVSKGRGLGKNHGESHGLSVLTEALVIEMRAMRESGVHYRVIAETYGHRTETVRRAVKGITWAHLPATRKVVKRARKCP